ncbi:MAG TPA: hypothetical protein VHL59_10185, partial [Thermoanaerobaculia bacterium]|nr:hypothetical protein [Thermoanaerobaculia bacterium]
MRSFARSCLRWILLYLVIGVLLSALVYARFPRAGFALGTGFGAALLVWFSIGYLGGMRERHAEVRLIRKGVGATRPEDGEKIAVCGAIGSSIDLLESPLTKRRCVAYEYKVLYAGNEQTALCEGFALTPATINGIRLLAAPDLAFKEEQYGAKQHRENLREYVAKTSFLVHEGIHFKRELAHFKSVLADDDGRIRYDIRREKTEDIAGKLDNSAMWEKVLLPGEKVCAIGRYSAARGGLVPDPTAIMHPVKIVKGDAEEVIRDLKKRDKTDVFLSCGCLLPVLVAAFVALAVVPLDAIEQMLPAKDPSWTEVRVERWLEKTLRPMLAGTPIVPKGEVAIELSNGQARGKLYDGASTIALTNASVTEAGEIIEVLILGDREADGTWRGAIARIHRAGRLESLQILNGPT